MGAPTLFRRLLEETIEKKDLLAYLELRGEEVHIDFDRDVRRAGKEEKTKFHHRHEGRLAEVERLAGLVRDGALKREGQRIWRKLRKLGRR